MKKNLGVKPYLYPMPVLIVATYNEDGTTNAMNAAWCSVCGFNKISLCISGAHKTVKEILKRKAFTVSVADEKNMVAADYVGVVSGNDTPDKMARSGFHTVKSAFVDAPVIEELPLVLECKLESFDDATSIMIGEIVNVGVEERALNDKGNIDVDKLAPLTYDPDNHTYVKLGKQVGIAYKEGLKLK